MAGCVAYLGAGFGGNSDGSIMILRIVILKTCLRSLRVLSLLMVLGF